jgi:metallo-beta-lactamase family protein
LKVTVWNFNRLWAFPGIKPLRELNWEPFPFWASTIDFVLLTHGHLDHLWLVAEVSRSRFQWKIYCSAPTKAIAKLILLDSQEEEQKKLNKGKYSKHEVAQPLYDVEQAKKSFPFQACKVK